MNKVPMLVTVLGLTILITACGFHTTSSGSASAGTARVHISQTMHKTNRTYADELWLMQRQPTIIRQTWTKYGCPPVYFAGGSYYFEPPAHPKTDIPDAIYLQALSQAYQPWPVWYDGPIPATPHYNGGCL
ncbi:hypothetical protein Sulac_1724 [Sulfobacillus acidophilus DSM 10332]|uniref:Uncharacterized protein n=1 Tax=Sulfobacillus acidophilus (strain ATCC 700253 / DSM 10332 / NAL) TaxID=679936 RepID=G8TZI0_SULAD|nr:hypothetical protein Sulac_1724 [Sulfobacillus acidophilus DSM 10332]